MDQFNDWQSSGHPWKIRKMEKARYSKLPLPPGYSWDDISYVIGGANKKSRYIDLNGYIITTAKDGSEAKTQYNIQDGSWSFYHKGEKKPYKCGPCHMTAYNKKGNQDGRPGMIGTWAEDGIGCEECHGAGADHPHKDLDCIECHDPHKRAILVKTDCGSCHEEVAEKYKSNIHAKAGKGCIECHMAKISKSAIKVNSYTGDVRTHIVKINTDADANMFMTIEEKGKKSTFSKGFTTLDYVCLGCHGSRDRKWASKKAKNIHK
jgi:hypothetical protein